jgi:hypothetical protein
MQPALSPSPGFAFWPGFIPLQNDHYCYSILQLTIHCRQHSTAQSVPVYCGLLPSTALCSPGMAQSWSWASAGSSALASNLGRNALLIDYQSTSVDSTIGGVGLNCFLGVWVGGWRGFVCIDRWLLAHGCWGLAVPFPNLALEVGHVGLVGELVQVLLGERSSGNSLRDTLGKRFESAVHLGAHSKEASRGSQQGGPPCTLRGAWIESEPP